MWAAWLFLPNLAKLLGSSDSMIGVIGASFGFSAFTSSYIFGRRTDIEGSKRYLHLGLLFSSLAVALILLTQDATSLIFFYFLAGLAIGMYPVTLIAYVFGKKVRLGKFSSFGSLGTGTGWVAAGLIAEYFAIKGVFTFSAVFFGVSFLISMTLPPMPKRRYKVPFFPVKLFRRYLSIFLSYLIRHIGANTVWIIYPLYIQSLGVSYFWISVLYAINPLGQFVLMYTVTDRLSANRLIGLGLLFSAAAFFSMSLAGNAWHIVPVQSLVATSWSCLYVGTLRYVTEGDVRKGTITGLLNSIIYLGNIVGPLAGGAISETTGSHRGNMIVAALMALFSLFLYELLARKKTGE